jgi:hypothetical protein
MPFIIEKNKINMKVICQKVIHNTQTQGLLFNILSSNQTSIGITKNIPKGNDMA